MRSDITFGITWHQRFGDLERLLRSLDRYFPGYRRIMIDTKGNLARARNLLAQACETKYFFMLEEDMEIIPETNIQLMHTIMERDNDLIGIGGAMDESHRRGKGTRVLCATYCIHNDLLRVDDKWPYVLDVSGTRYITCDLIFNFGLFRTKELQRHPWDERLPQGQHYPWYYQIWKTSDVCRFAVCDSIIKHWRSRPTPAYRELRSRDRQWHRKAEQLLGVKYDLKFSTDDRFLKLLRDGKHDVRDNSLPETA